MYTQQVHVQSKVKVSIGNITTILYVLYVPDTTVESVPNLTKLLCQPWKFTFLVSGFSVRNALLSIGFSIALENISTSSSDHQ